MSAINWKQYQRGSVVIVVVLVMLALSVIGVLSIHTSVVDLKIAVNEKGVRQTLYLSESAAMEGVQRLADAVRIDLEEQFAFWHHRGRPAMDEPVDFRSFEDWDVDGQGEDNGLPSALGPHIYLAAVEWRLATGSSAIVTGPRLYLNRVYGLCNTEKSRHIVEIGAYKRY